MSDKIQLKCPLCGSTDFKTEEGKIDSKWGLTAHKVRIKICNNCQFIMMFSKGRTIFDFD
jgi:RNA polymerase subunit RPABC4/transcription elongation factor Spt4